MRHESLVEFFHKIKRRLLGNPKLFAVWKFKLTTPARAGNKRCSHTLRDLSQHCISEVLFEPVLLVYRKPHAYHLSQIYSSRKQPQNGKNLSCTFSSLHQLKVNAAQRLFSAKKCSPRQRELHMRTSALQGNHPSPSPRFFSGKISAVFVAAPSFSQTPLATPFAEH